MRITVYTAASKNIKAGKKTVKIHIVPGATKKMKVMNLSKGFRISWTKVTGANGYVIYRNGKKIKVIQKASTLTYKDTTADNNGRKYVYKVYAKAYTGRSTIYKSVTAYRAIVCMSSSGKKTRYCFEDKYVESTLENSESNELAVIDMDGVDQSVITDARKRGVQIYGDLNAGALENSRSYYSKFRHLRLAEYEGWDGEYWIDVTGRGN